MLRDFLKGDRMRRKEREIKDIKELVKILSKTCVGTLSLSGGEYPYAVPLNFGFSENDGKFKVYFHCAGEGRKAELLRDNPKVCFEVHTMEKITGEGENPCVYSCAYESVIGFGCARELKSHEEKKAALIKIMENCTGREFDFNEKQTNGVTVFEIDFSEVTGKRSRG